MNQQFSDVREGAGRLRIDRASIELARPQLSFQIGRRHGRPRNALSNS